jgi:non-specific protein-tyrosine kinase
MSRVYDALRKAQEEKEDVTDYGLTTEDRERPEVSKDARQEKATDRPGGEGRQNETQPRKVKSAEPFFLRGMDQTGIDKSLIAFIDPQGLPAEQFRKLRTILSQYRLARDARVIMITSSLTREGKTTAACNLAVTLVQGLDDRAILVDCDLRKPKIHHIFGIEGKPGLAECLAGRSHLAQIINQPFGPDLKIIPAGRCPAGPSELISSDNMSKLLSELKTRYEGHYIILDSTPVLLTSETGALAQMVDGILFVITAGKTSRESVKRALKEIKGDKMIGIVLNNAEPEDEYRSKYYRDYYQSPS